jgi:hypothetical protein
MSEVKNKRPDLLESLRQCIAEIEAERAAMTDEEREAARIKAEQERKAHMEDLRRRTIEGYNKSRNIRVEYEGRAFESLDEGLHGIGRMARKLLEAGCTAEFLCVHPLDDQSCSHGFTMPDIVQVEWAYHWFLVDETDDELTGEIITFLDEYMAQHPHLEQEPYMVWDDQLDGMLIGADDALLKFDTSEAGQEAERLFRQEFSHDKRIYFPPLR